jgi:TRAP-type C4-dicarboxylate transport system permease small subunit
VDFQTVSHFCEAFVMISVIDLSRGYPWSAVLIVRCLGLIRTLPHLIDDMTEQHVPECLEFGIHVV